MSGSIENTLNKLKTELDAALLSSENTAHVQFAQLCAKHLLAANTSLLEARKSAAAGDQKASDALCRMTAYHLEMAASHAKASGRPVREHFSGQAQHYASLLVSGIIEFKSLVEWKNCTLRPALKNWFIEIVDLFEDAMNYLRFNKMAEAERAALAGLILHDHLCRAAQDENFGLISIAGRCAKTKLSGEATNLRSITETLSVSRRKMLKSEDALTDGDGDKMRAAYEAAEIIFIESIMAFADDNKKSVQAKILVVHSHISIIDQITIECHHLIQDHSIDQRAAGGKDAQAGTKAAQQDNADELAVPASFDKDVTNLHAVLNSRVDDAELLRLRIMAISRFYRLLHKAYSEAKYQETIVLAVSARAELQKVHLLFLQAELFAADRK